MEVLTAATGWTSMRRGRVMDPCAVRFSRDGGRDAGSLPCALNPREGQAQHVRVQPASKVQAVLRHEVDFLGAATSFDNPSVAGQL